jgi:hypothetical protein
VNHDDRGRVARSRLGPWLWLAAGLVLACQDAGRESAAKRMPATPPPPQASIPAGLQIAVEVDGRPAAAIDAARLAALRPDYEQGEHRAWKLASLLGAPFGEPGSVVEAVGASGIAVLLRPAASETEPQPVLALTRRGEVAAALVAPADPFPDYHGQGGRLRRPGDPLPRITPVTALKVVSRGQGGGGGGGGGGGAGAGAPPAADTADPAVLAKLTLTIDGHPVPGYDAALVARIATRRVLADGEERRAWSLRDIAEAAAPGARAVAVVGEGGKRVPLDPSAWADRAQTPTLRTNRRGTSVKFGWVVEATGMSRPETELREITAVELTR